MAEITVLIPAYCPDEKLIALVSALRSRNAECVVVNDGSPDEYDHIFEILEKDITVLRHETNRGKGAALKTGMAYVYERNRSDIIVTADADGQHTVSDIIKCAQEASSHADSLVLGVRSFRKEGVPLRSRMGNRASEFIFHMLSGCHVSDTQSGLRAFPVSMVPEFLGIEGDRYEYEMNQLFVCAKKKIPIHEVPIETVYEGNNECSHFSLVKDSMRIVRQMMKFSLSSLASFAIDTSLFAFLSSLFGFEGGIAAANVSARVCSAAFNYEVNRKAVFADHSQRSASLGKYAALALFILAGNTAVLYLLIQAGMGTLSAKILTEMLFFLISFTIQNRFVFSAERSQTT